MHIARPLLDWYAVHRRQLPWRGERDVYRIWISEIILQQTQIAQGWDYYLRFLNAFPTVEALAAAPEDAVLRQWQGLGYYSRARNLHAAAQEVVRQGCFPTTYDGVRALRGIGDYTAAAICSMAYGLPVAAVDGNAVRVLSRLATLDKPFSTAAGKREVYQLAQEQLDAERPGDYNQAMMDLGSMVCTPRAPQCADCPLAAQCVAHRLGVEEQYPVRGRRTHVEQRPMLCVRILSPDGVALRRRRGNDIWRGLYEYLLLDNPDRLEVTELHQPLLTAALAMPGAVLHEVRRGVKHVLSHRVITADFYDLRVPPQPLPPSLAEAGFFWAANESLQTYALPKLLLKDMA